jgi:uncharacterized protein (TIGR03083 family)
MDTAVALPSVPLPEVDDTAAQAAVADAGARVSALLRSVTHPEAPALGEWGVTDVAVHLSHTVDIVGAMATGADSVATVIWDVSKLTTMLVAGETERDLGVLATRVDASIAGLLAALRSSAGGNRRQWLIQGVEMPLSTIACHALNELVVHGRDIARADGVPWPIERAHATLVLQGFLFPVLAAIGGSMVDQAAAAGVKATYDVRLRGGGRVAIRFDDGDLTVTDVPEGPVDCHLSVDPVTFMLVAWNRVGQWPAIGRGQLLAWGRRPWLGLKLRAMLRNP